MNSPGTRARPRDARALVMIFEKPGQFYRWLFYRCYRYSLKADGRIAIHWANASIYVLMIITMNVIVIFFASAFIFGYFFVVPSAPRWILFLIAAAIALLHTFLLGYKGRYKKIIGAFQKESDEQQRRGDLLFGWYLVSSLFLMIAVFVIAFIDVGGMCSLRINQPC
jgi:hypothetical protein